MENETLRALLSTVDAGVKKGMKENPITLALVEKILDQYEYEDIHSVSTENAYFDALAMFQK
jgi:hypothetical protein